MNFWGRLNPAGFFARNPKVRNEAKVHQTPLVFDKRRPFFSSVILFAILASLLNVSAAAQAQTPEPSSKVQSMLASMTPEEKVGQLFLVTFTGTDTSETSQIYDLIVRRHIGGVVLLASNDNFTAAPQTVPDAYSLINHLQQLEWDSATGVIVDPVTGQGVRSNYTPLFVGLAQAGDGSPADQVFSGLTPLPSEMAIGASWSIDLASQVGAVQGRELSALGVNLYLGPSLDVLEQPSSIAGGDLGTHVFGGDPYWAGEMGRAYISGLHLGSGNRMLVIAKHFPGRGGSDRLPEEEVSTVRKSLEQLKQVELAPFFAVTGNAASPDASVDGLLISHIRYQGFQGNIRATTRPVSFDAQALATILTLPQFASWRDAGGLIVSDDLGTRAVREFYAPGGAAFAARLAVRDVFLAGNDLMYLGDIVSSDAPDTYNSTVKILDFFAQKYREDPAFAQRVDAALTRILSMKFKLYDNFLLSNVVPPQSGVETIGQSTDVTFNAARSAATLISPERQDFATLLPAPPQVGDRMVFITDTTLLKQCSTCLEQPALAVDALQQTILKLYGPASGNLTSNFRLASHSFTNLQDMLNGVEVPFIETDLTRANWVILSITDSSNGQPALVSRFLRERQDLLRQKRVILFSFGAPYYFDATDISNLTAFFALYSYQPPFVDVAARLLFQELTPSGAPPVSIPGIGYDLNAAMTPDPNQIISLSLDLPPAPVSTGTPVTPEPTAIPLYRIGDTIAIRTGVIIDHNGHSVPDGTVVKFSMVLTGEGGGITQEVETVTTQGLARASFGLDKPGLLEIRVASAPAVISNFVQLDVSQSGAVAVTVIVPALTESVTPTPTIPATPVEDAYISTEGYPRFNSWFLSMLLIVFSVWAGYWLGSRLAARQTGVRIALGILLGGLIVYNYFIFGFPGAAALLTSSGLTGLITFILVGELAGLGAGWVWSRR